MKAVSLPFLLLSCFAANLCLPQSSFAQGVPLTFGHTNSGTISLPGQEDRFVFTGSVGQRLYYDAFDLDFDPINVRLLSPGGQLVWELNHSADYGPFHLTQAGNYTMIVDGQGDTTGDYAFRLVDLSGATAISYGAIIAGQLAPQSGTVAYRFNGTNGQRLSLQSIAASSGDGYWRIVGAANQTLRGPEAIDTDLGEVVLPATDSYLVLVEGASENIGVLDFQFRVDLLSSPSGSAAGFNIVHSGDTVADQTNDFSYSGPAGLPVYIDSLTNTSPVTIYFIDATDEPAIVVGGGSDYGPYILPRSGNYTLRVVGYDAGSYQFRVLNLNASTTSLTPGVTYSAALNPAFRTDVYRFTGSPGQRIYCDALDFDFDNVATLLVSPDNVSFVFNFNADSDAGPFTLTQPGTYQLFVASQTDDPAADYSFRLLDTMQSPAVSVSLNVNVPGNNTPGSAASYYRFSGLAGQRLYFDFAGTNGAGSWVLYDAADQPLISNALSGDGEVSLPGTGEYSLTVGNGGTMDPVPFAFRILTPATTTNALVLGATTSGTLTGAGEEHRFTFSGNLGQRLYYDALNNGIGSITVQLFSPGGVVTLLNGNSDLDVGPFTLTETGTYVLLQKATSEITGSYSFRLIDVAQSPAAVIALDSQVNGSATTGTRGDLYRFTGTVGQRLFFDAMATNGPGSWYLYGPENQYLGGAGLSGDFEVTLTQSGTHALVVGNSGSLDANGYSIRIVTPTTTTNALTLGATVNGTLTEAGEEDWFSFSGTAGQRFFYDAMEAEFDAVEVQLHEPNGAVNLIYGNSDSDAGPFTLSYTGTYRLLLKGTGDYTSDYRFRLLDVAAASAVSYGVTVSNQLNPQISAQIYRINGTAGQTIGITNLGASSANANWFLFGPGNATLLANNVLSDLGNLTLPTTGTYALVVAGTTDLIGGLTYQFRVSLLSSASGGTAGFATVRSGNTSLDQTNSFSYTGPSGLPVYFDALTNDSPVSILLIAPSGNLVFNVGGASDAGPFFLPESGNYTLRVIGYADGSFAFRLLNMNNDSTALTIGTTYSATPAPAFGTDIYRFSVTNDQRLYFDSLDTDGESLAVALFNPGGSAVFFGGDHYDTGPFSINQAGEHFLVIASPSADPSVDYEFRVLQAAQAPVAILPFDTTINDVLNPGGAADLFRFTGSAGTRLYFDAAPTNDSATWALSGPLNQPLGGGYLQGDFETTLPSSGEYLLVVSGNLSANPLPYSVRVVTPNTTTNALVLGSTITGPITEPGAEARYTFTGTAGQQLYYDALDGEGDSITATLLSPSGATVFGIYAEYDFAPFTLAYSGTYTLVFRGNGDATGAFRFRLLDTSTATPLALDSVVNGTLSTAYEARLFQLPALAGLRLIQDWATTYDFRANYSIHAPNATYVTGNTFGNESEFTPSHTGNQLLVLSSSSSEAVPYSFQFVPANHAPVLAAIGNRTVSELVTLMITNIATDLEAPNDLLTFTLDTGSPSNATIHPVTGVFTWTPNEGQGPGIYPVTVRVTDNGIPNFNDFETFNITVNEVNLPPLLNVPGNLTNNELVALNISATATDPDLPTNTLAFSLVSPPPGMTINPASGAISWTPTEAQGPSTNVITVVVNDTNPPAINTKQFSVTNTFTVLVNEVNVAPLPSVQTNRTINELTTLTVTNTATDADLPANVLTYSLLTAPPTATINPANGVISWTPAEADGPGVYPFVTRIMDNGSPPLSGTNTFNVTVNEVNLAPTLIPPANRTIHAGVTLSVTATATDPDLPANTLTYAKVGGPTALTVSSGGLVAWNTSDTAANTTNTITLRVSDNGTPNLSHTNNFVVTVLPRPLLASIVYSNQTATVRWSAIPGTSYRLLYSTNVASINWSNVPGDITASSNSAVKTDAPTGSDPSRAYRVRVLP